MSTIEDIQSLIENDCPEQAIKALDTLIPQTSKDDHLFYLRGKAYLKTSNWQKALENFLEAKYLNPESPAQEALAMTNQILEFYHKDVYGQ